ncbi:TenA family protein [Sphingobacterium faecale]|uniref:TenA family protein n=1 Tax=Sphingobacterium faecale TaxID=2803775 RepID=A0ABS1QYS8_9SPHI|nr:TenA family protein [Sphingobacterium faecale]MBL1407586.1 TenA family protein [Sphingobacterium faecale]
MTWTNQAWQTIQPLYQEILDMPFIHELKNGTLPLAKFQFYMQQDARYLEHYGRVLAYMGSKCTDNDQALDFFDFGKNALIVERALHESYFTQFGIPKDSVTADLEPVCHHYVHFLKSTAAFDPLEVALAAVLPCFVIYKEVGDYIISAQTRADNPYKNWIDTYSGPEFGIGVQKALGYVNAAAERTTDAIRKQMLDAYVTASRMEFKFWDAAYNKTTW